MVGKNTTKSNLLQNGAFCPHEHCRAKKLAGNISSGTRQLFLDIAN